ncbi:c-type cytochrome [Pontibacter sp. BT310]|uniref:C-type cytochrome n=1 Tax=Pontibacter populi TaxID=890055 RepID=A0ABS6X836_9BACT|nr:MULTISPECIES: cytochrome c [Pontibacter]MBJ6117301.1 c-type cytochrome [Pontibacter sp. BT310]MBR0569726.1 c-type cytochrome [Microvirga sp. STS03]MBW3364154.1 c-type cytochrome [Pontibacter populi]
MKTLLYSLLICLFLIACGTAKRGEPAYAPVADSEPAIAQGQVVFNTYCTKCHPGGEAGLAPSFNDKPLPGFLMRFQVRHGLGVMPAFKEEVISDDELDHLIAYIKTLKKAKDDKAAPAS